MTPVQAQKLEKLVIGYPAPVASLGIIDVMRKGGLFKKNGLDIDLVYIQGSPVLTTAMVSGQVPLSFLGGAALIASAVGGADTVYLACGINTLYWRFFTTPDIKTIADFKGKTLGVTPSVRRKTASFVSSSENEASFRIATSPWLR